MTEMNNPENKNDTNTNSSEASEIHEDKIDTGAQSSTAEAEEIKAEEPKTSETVSDTGESSSAPVDAEFRPTGNIPPKPPVKQPKEKKKLSSAMIIALCAVVSLACGLGGGYAAVQTFGSKTTIIYQEVSSTSSAGSVATDSSSSSGAMSVQEVASKASPSVVEIVVSATESGYGMFGQSYTSEGAGSGVIISSDGYIITNNHVVEDADKISVTLYDGTSYDAELIGTDSKSDIAVIKVNADGLTAAVIGDSDSIQVGDTAVVIGNPLGTLGGTVTDGIISATDREITINNESMNLIQTNAAINSGNSGGGLFSDTGSLIGIVNAKDSGTTSSGATIEGLGFAIPINDAMTVAQDLIANGYVSDRATLGVYLQDVTSDYQDYKAGLYISEVITGSGADEAGLQAYDRIIAADGTEVSSYTELSKILKTKSVGDTITLTIVRDSKQMDVTVTLTAAIQDTSKS